MPPAETMRKASPGRRRRINEKMQTQLCASAPRCQLVACIVDVYSAAHVWPRTGPRRRSLVRGHPQKVLTPRLDVWPVHSIECAVSCRAAAEAVVGNRLLEWSCSGGLSASSSGPSRACGPTRSTARAKTPRRPDLGRAAVPCPRRDRQEASRPQRQSLRPQETLSVTPFEKTPQLLQTPSMPVPMPTRSAPVTS